MKFITEDEREDYLSLVDEACGDDPRPNTTEAAPRLRDLLLAAEQAGRPWASLVLDDAQLAGLVTQCRDRLQRRERAIVAFDGEMISKPARRSVRARRDTGETFSQQTLFRDATRQEISEMLEREQRQVRASQVTITLLRKLLELLDAVAGANTPGDAAKKLGVSVEEWLAS